MLGWALFAASEAADGEWMLAVLGTLGAAGSARIALGVWRGTGPVDDARPVYEADPVDVARRGGGSRPSP